MQKRDRGLAASRESTRRNSFVAFPRYGTLYGEDPPMTNHPATGAVRRAGLAFCTFAVLVLSARISLADPPPKPTFKVYNDSRHTISGKFKLQYWAQGGSSETVELEGSMVPHGGSLLRSLPDQIDKAVDADPASARVVGAGISGYVLTVDGLERYIYPAGGTSWKPGGLAMGNFALRDGSLRVTYWPPTPANPVGNVTLYVSLP